jgi:protease-4
MFEEFLDVVDRGRPDLTREQVRKLADGRVYLADQALEAGLIDRIAPMHETIAALKEELNLERIRLVTYRRPIGFRPNYYAEARETQAPGSQLNLINVETSSWWLPATPRFLYLWAPGR